MKKIFVFLIALLGVMTLTSCKKDNSDKIVFTWWGTGTRTIGTRAVIKAFETKYPEYKDMIKEKPLTWNGYSTRLNNDYKASDEADIIQVNYDFLYNRDGWFQDLKALDINLDNYPPEEHDPLTVNGELLALSISETGYNFYLNEKVYKDAGVEIPKTWDELRAAGRTINGKDNNKYALGRLGAQQVAMIMWTYLAQKYGNNVIENNKLAFTEEQLQEAFEFIGSLITDKVLVSLRQDPSNLGPANPQWQTRGNYGGIMQWNTAIEEYYSTFEVPNAKLICAGMFQLNEGDNIGMYKKVSMAYAVSKRRYEKANDTKKQAIKLFLEYITSDEEAIKNLGVDRGVPSRSTAQEFLRNQVNSNNIKYSETLEWQGHDVVQSMYNNQLTRDINLYIHPYYEDATFRESYEGPIESFLLGTSTAAKAAENISRVFDAQLEAAMKRKM